MRPAIVILGTRSETLARRVASLLPEAEILAPEAARIAGATPFESAAGVIRTCFAEGRPIIGVCAAGILIRALAPLLADKRGEPPVVALDETGSVAVPLLGGHRGANALARDLAAGLGAHAAITTAGDGRFGLALDAPPKGWRLANPDDAKAFMAACLEGAAVRLVDEHGLGGWLREGGLPLCADAGGLAIEVTAGAREGDARHLVYHPPVLALGIGCERGADADEVRSLAMAALEEAGLAAGAVACVVSLDLKAAEPAIHALAGELGVPARFFDRDELAAMEPLLATPSAVVKAEVGVAGVAEAAALAAAGDGGRLVLPKRKSARATCAIAMASAPLDGASVGRAQGTLHLVGLGPGSRAWRTHEAEEALARATDVVGYGLYLDLAAPLIHGKRQHRFALGEERERCRFALELAAKGLDVALLCSGDPGIYAMAALVTELLEQTQDAAEARVALHVVPGISALQGAAARIGAPLGHDFCAISLSDLLTPRAVIERRIEAAAAGDFVTALYNPVSRRRRDLLLHARDVMLRHRPADTPCVIARNLGRDDERVEVVELAALSVDAVDMLTVVLIGAAGTRRFSRPDGNTIVFTPRGYEVT